MLDHQGIMFKTVDKKVPTAKVSVVQIEQSQRRRWHAGLPLGDTLCVDAPSPRYMRERATWSGRVREVAVPLGLARGKATCLIGPLQSHWAGSGGNGLRARSGALWAGGDATGD